MIKRNIIILLTGLMVAFASIGVVSVVVSADCAGVKTSVINCTTPEGESRDAIIAVIASAVRIMTAGIGILAVGATITGGVLYSMSGNNPENVKKAKTIWMNTVIGLIVFAFTASITHFLVPGGVF